MQLSILEYNYVEFMHISIRLHYIIIVTGFAKRGLPHTSDLQASTIYKFRLLKGMDLQILQFRVLT